MESTSALFLWRKRASNPVTIQLSKAGFRRKTAHERSQEKCRSTKIGESSERIRATRGSVKQVLWVCALPVDEEVGEPRKQALQRKRIRCSPLDITESALSAGWVAMNMERTECNDLAFSIAIDITQGKTSTTTVCRWISKKPGCRSGQNTFCCERAYVSYPG